MNDGSLIDAILSGDESATSILMNRYKDFAFTLSLRILKNREDAEEVVHDSILKALRSLNRFNRNSSFKTWLFRIVHNTSISRLRKNKMNDTVVDSEMFFEKESFYVEEPISEYDIKTVLAKVLETLKAADRALIELFYFENLDLKEVSEVLSLSEANVKVKLFRIRKKLATEIVKSHAEIINQIT
ncbi:MAG: sigma-70 family RNA polymerase sigma factor [Bacteroidota bacterium]